MAEGGSFLNPGVGEPSRRAFLDVDKRVKAAQDDAASALAQIAALSPDHGSLLGLGDDDHSQYHNDARGDARYLQLTGGSLSGHLQFSASSGSSNIEWTGATGPMGLKISPGGTFESALYYRTSPDTWSFENASGDDILCIDIDGQKVGVNTDSPSYELDVVGNIRTQNSGGANAKMGAWQANDDYAMFGTDDMTGAEYCVLAGGSTDGNTYISAQSGAGVYIRPSANSSTNAIFVGTGGVTIGGNTVWHAGNDGSGSGLDADLLDGYHASSFIRLGQTYSVSNGITRFLSNNTLPTTSGSQSSLEIYQDNSGSDAFISFHVAGDYAAYFGLDGGTNDFAVGGWSMGANSYKVWHAGNSNKDGVDWTCEVLRVNEARADNGSASDPSFTFNSDQDTGIYRQGSGSIGFSTNGVQHYWNSAGIYLASGDWFRTTGQAGWYNQTYSGGIYMVDSTWVRTYNNKAFYTSGNLRGDGQIQTARNSTGNIGGASINLGLGNGSGVIFTMNPSGYGPLITVGQGEHFYVRNYLNNAYAIWDAIIINRSSVHDKHNIMTLGEVPRSVGSASNPLEAFDAMEKVRQLRPVSYQWHEQNALPRMPCHEDGTPNERRINALSRLNKIRKSKGLSEFQADYLKHQCGRDCEHSLDEPCFRVKNYRNGKMGFIAQEVGELIPAATHLSEERDEPESVDPVALIAVVTKAVQQLDDRLRTLEGAA